MRVYVVLLEDETIYNVRKSKKRAEKALAELKKKNKVEN